MWKKKPGVGRYIDRVRPASARFNPGALMAEIPEVEAAGLINEREDKDDGCSLLTAVCASSLEGDVGQQGFKVALVRALLEAGADPLLGRRGGARKDRDALGHAHALSQAVWRGETPLVGLMLRHCAPSQEQQAWLWVFAVKGGHRHMWRFLLEAGIPYGTGGESGMPLWSHATTVEDLADLRQTLPSLPLDVVGRTTLATEGPSGLTEGHRAAALSGDDNGEDPAERLAWWLSEGGNPSLEDSQGGNVLTCAVFGYYSVLVEKAGAKPRPIPRSLWTAMRLLRERGCSMISVVLASPGRELSGMDVLLTVLRHTVFPERLRLIDALVSTREWLTPNKQGKIPLTRLSEHAPDLAQKLMERWVSYEAACKLTASVCEPENQGNAGVRRPRL